MGSSFSRKRPLSSSAFERVRTGGDQYAGEFGLEYGLADVFYIASVQEKHFGNCGYDAGPVVAEDGYDYFSHAGSSSAKEASSRMRRSDSLASRGQPHGVQIPHGLSHNHQFGEASGEQRDAFLSDPAIRTVATASSDLHYFPRNSQAHLHLPLFRDH